ncbi:MAG TPA: ABC transporter permease [Patescibacteria group bacterium]|nr:ABC transporter permease [Patescibacteria group bacterium]
MWGLVWKSLVHRRVQSLSTVLVVGMSVAILFSVALLYEGMANGMEAARQRLGADILVIPGDVVLEAGTVLFTGAPVNAYFPATVLNAIRDVPGVGQATPQFFSQTLPEKCCNLTLPVRIIGFDSASDWVISPWIKNPGNRPLGTEEAIVGSRVDVQDKLLLLGRPFTVVNVLEYTGTAMDYSVLLSLDVARELAHHSEELGSVWRTAGPPENLLSAVLVKVAPDADREAVIAGIHAQGYFRVIVATDVMQQMRKQLILLLTLLGLAGLLTLTASLLQLFVRFYSQTMERQSEWGLYLAMGAARKQIAALIAAEALCLSVSGALGGLVLGSLLYGTILGVIRGYYDFPFGSPSGWYVLGLAVTTLLLFVILGGMAAWLPAHRGSRSEPADIMTRGEYN